jgi:hypothetical protein
MLASAEFWGSLSMNAVQDRRQTEGRRTSVAAIINDDKRINGRRENPDRRGAYLNITLDGEQFIFMMCTWLDTNARGAWHIGPNENEPNNSAARFRIRFDDDYDLEAFKIWLETWGYIN